MPNVGKTTLYNALTGRRDRTGNYHGVTTGLSYAQNRYDRTAVVYDLPGLYTLGGGKMEETIAARALSAAARTHRNIKVVQVVDARHLERSLPLTAELAKRRFAPVLALTMSDRLRKKGGSVDAAKLSRSLGVNCILVNAHKKSSVRDFYSTLCKITDAPSNTNAAATATITENTAATATPATNTVANTTAATVKTAETTVPQNKDFEAKKTAEKLRRFARGERIDGYKKGKQTNRVYVGAWLIPAFFLIVAAVFYTAFGNHSIGVCAKRTIESAFDKLSCFFEARIENAFFRTVVCRSFFGGVGGVLSFLPQLAILYFFSGILEESGAMSYLAYATDGIFSAIGLSGRAAFCIFLGYGCTAVGVSSTAALENVRAQKRAIVCLHFVPCSAKLPVYLALLSSLFKNAFFGAVLLYVLGTGIGLCVSAFFGGSEENFIMEIADFCIPSPISALKNLLFRLKGFIIKVSLSVFAFTVAANVLSTVNVHGACEASESFLARLSGVLVYLFYPMGVRDSRAAFAAVAGLLAKENIAGLLFSLCPEGLALGRAATAAYLAFIALLPPCVTAIGATAKELGKRTTVQIFLWQIAGAYACAYAVRFVFLIGTTFALVCAAALLCLIVFLLSRRQRNKTSNTA